MTAVLDYHQTTKHSFNRFARSLGYLDWAAQPDPFRRYDGAPQIPLPRAVLRSEVPYTALFDQGASPTVIDEAAIGEFLRCSMGLSAWKQYQASRWALRVNPSSGNLHPTECYIVWNDRVSHYAPREHALEVRATLGREPAAGETEVSSVRDTFLVGLTSILWREAWKYGERAFRYCQHDVGHAIGALRFAAALLGWRLTLLDDLADAEIATILGVDRSADYGDAEREEAECLAVVTRAKEWQPFDGALLVERSRRATWSGKANILSRSHMEWPIIDEVAAATRKPPEDRRHQPPAPRSLPPDPGPLPSDRTARRILLQRRSALGFDAHSALPAATFMSMLRRLDPGRPPWDAIYWPAQVHLILFVHRVDGLIPGLYAYVRDPSALDGLRGAMHADFMWERRGDPNDSIDSNLFLLVPTDVRFAANRLSCDQDIASDGFFAVAMLARLDDSIRERGEWFYRRLFWETGIIGQVLYLEAEAVGARSTGIGCFYDDPVHDTLGISGMQWQSLYHFSMGMAVDDGRLTNQPGYPGDW